MTQRPEPNQPPEPSDSITQVLTELKELRQEVERFNDRFSNYQQSTQWFVQLAFTLIASATITVIITAVLRR